MADSLVQLTARQWATIDPCMDNAIKNAIDAASDPEPAQAIRQAGWDQVPWVGEGRRWPPMEQVLTTDDAATSGSLPWTPWLSMTRSTSS